MFAKLRAKAQNGLANVSLIIGLVGGLFASVSTVGHVLNVIVDVGPWWTPAVLTGIFLTILLFDWLKEGIPNRPAVYSALIGPSMLVGTFTGDCGAKFLKLIGAFDKQAAADLTAKVKDWTGVTGDVRGACTVFSLIAIGMAITYAQRYAKDARSNRSGMGNMPTPPRLPAGR